MLHILYPLRGVERNDANRLILSVHDSNIPQFGHSGPARRRPYKGTVQPWDLALLVNSGDSGVG